MGSPFKIIACTIGDFEKELPVQIIARAGEALQTLFGPLAVQAAEVSQVIVRRRNLTPLSLARTFVLGFLHKPMASDEDLARLAAQAGTPVTPQAIEQRHTPKLVRFLKELFYLATKQVVAADKALAPLLQRFSSVVLLDSSTIALPACQREEYPGCGGSYGGGAAALKLQTELDLNTGAVTHVEVEAGCRSDGRCGRQTARRGPGSLRVSDLGYFDLEVFAEAARNDEYFLSRLQFGTQVLSLGGTPLALLVWLAQPRRRPASSTSRSYWAKGGVCRPGSSPGACRPKRRRGVDIKCVLTPANATTRSRRPNAWPCATGRSW
jgi:Transposase DDE domain